MIKRILCLLLSFVFIVAFSSCKKSVDETVTSTEPESYTLQSEENSSLLMENDTTVPDTVDDELAGKLEAICKKYGATGVQSAFIKNNSYYSSYCYGIADKKSGMAVCEDTKYRVASLSKLITDIVFMQLQERGLVDENTDIGNYLGFKVRNPRYPDTIITPRMLMLHTSSVTDSSGFLSSRQNGSSISIEKLLASPDTYSASAPGASCIYSNFGNALIGSVCEKASGKCFDELAHELLFDPMDIDCSYVASGLKNSDLLGALYGSGGMSKDTQLAAAFCSAPGQTHHLVQGNLTVSAKDYAKLLCVLMNNGIAPNGKRILSPEAVAAIKTPGFDEGTWQVGRGVYIQDNIIGNNKVFVHTGSNFGMYSAFVFSDELGMGVVVLTSGADGSKDRSTDIYNVCLDIIRAYFEK